MKIWFSCAMMALLAGPAIAAPSFDCAKAASDAEELICADNAMAVLDQRLARTYEKAQTAAASHDNSLRATQRGWIKGRDDCWKADNLRACVEASYLLREGELVATWILLEPSGVTAYSCENNPANEVTVFFFDTELPSIRLEYGDSISTGSLVPTASGSKYATSLGGMIWMKGNEAQFSWDEGTEMSCVMAN